MKGFLETDAGRLEYARWGSSDTGRLPVLLLHEGLGSVSLWKAFPEQLAAATGREVIAWSRHGHGHSAGIQIAHDVDYMHREADLLPVVHDALGLERAHWLGHSDGGSIALIAAARYPALVSSLILEAPHVYVEKLTLSSIAQIAAGFANSDMGERMKKYHRDPSSMFHRWTEIWLNPAFLEWNIEEVLSDLTVPVLLIQGLDDQYGTLDQLARIEASLSETERLELSGCGHSPHHERTDAVLTKLTEYLNGKA